MTKIVLEVREALCTENPLPTNVSNHGGRFCESHLPDGEWNFSKK